MQGRLVDGSPIISIVLSERKRLLERMVCMENQSIVHVNSLKCYDLIDSGSMVSTVSDHVLKLMKPVPVVKNLEEFQLSVSVAGGSKLPYSGYIEVEVQIKCTFYSK